MAIAATIIGWGGLALVVHEAGHAAACQALGLRWRPVLTRYGPGIRVGGEGPVTPAQVRLTAAGGPVANVLLCVVLWRAGQGLGVLCSAEMFLANAIPLPRSDGLRVLRGAA